MVPFGAHSDRNHHRNEVAREQQLDVAGVDVLDVAQKSQVRRVGVAVAVEDHRARLDEAAILAIDPHRAASVTVDQRRQFLIELGQRHLDHRQRARVSDAMAAVSLRLHAHLLEQLVDAPTAAMHDDGLHADEPQQRDVAGEAVLELRIAHRLATESDHQRLAVEGAQVGQRFGENAGFLSGGRHLFVPIEAPYREYGERCGEAQHDRDRQQRVLEW